MADGLIGGFGSFGQRQGQTQGNLLGGVFQQQPTRGELRRGLLSDVVQQFGGNAQQTAGAAIGAGLGIGISKLLGRDVQGAERADKIRRVQERVNSQFGDQFASDPYSAFTGTAQALFDEGLVPEANAALREAENYKPEPVETERVIRGGTELGEAAGLREGESAVGTFVDGRITSLSDIERPKQPETFTPLTTEEKQRLNLDPTKFAQRNNLTRRIHTAGGQTINVGDESNPAFDALTDQFKNDLTQASEAATQATGLLQEVNRATDLLSQEDFSTGAVRPVLTGLRGIAEDLGVSIDPALREAGVENLGEVSDAESFRAFSSNLTTRIAGRLPSNLNQSEINLILDASSQLGKTPEANASALAAFKASAELTQRNASRLTEAAAEGTQELIAEQRRQREKGTEEFEALAERYKEEILEQRSGAASDTSQGGGRLRYNPETGRVE